MDTPFSFIGAADAYIDILSDTAVRTGLALQGNCTEFVPKPDSERKEQVGTGRSNYGQVIASATMPKPMTAKITFNQLSQALFAAAFFGTSSAFTQTADPLADQAVTTIADRYVEIGKKMISNVVVKNTAGDTTYESGTDYAINPRLGMIMALSSGAIAADESVKVSCDCEAIAGTQMKGMTKSNVRIRIKLDGQNYADGRNFISDIYQMRLAPTSEFSLIGTEFVDVTFEGSLETPTGFSEPMDHIWLS